MATGDPIAAAILAEGWLIDVEFEGLAGLVNDTTYQNQATKYAMGDIHNPAGNIGNAVLTSHEWGYTNKVKVVKPQTILLTKVLRQAYPNTTVIEERVTNTTNMTVTFALSESVYEKAKNGGAGTTGTDPTIDIAAGLIIGQSNAVIGLPVTNNSTKQYKNVVGQWDWDLLRGGWRTVKDAFVLGFRARAGRFIDTVTLSAIGETSGTTITSDETEPQSTQSPGTGIYHESYQMDVPIINMDQGEKILFRAIAYPAIGDELVVLDTNNRTAVSDRIRGDTTCWHVCDKDDLLVSPFVAIVDQALGNNGTGVVASEATARLNPFAQIGAALNAGAKLVYVKNSGTPIIVGGWGATPDTDFYLQVAEDPQDPGVYLSRDTINDDNYRRNLLCYRDIGLRFVGTGNGWLDGEGGNRQLLFERVRYDTQVQPSVGLGLGSSGCWYLDCINMDNENLGGFGASKVAYSVTGCIETSAGGAFGTGAGWTWIANYTADGNMAFFSKGASNPAPDHHNLMVEFNRAHGMIANGTGSAFVNLSITQQDICILGNECEVKSITSSGPIFWLWGDGNTAPCSNVLFIQNTFDGERANNMYNDNGAVAVLRDDMFVRGNAGKSYNTKGDDYLGGGGPNGNRTGNWQVMWACNCSDNMWDGTAGSEFIGEFVGLRSSFELNGTLSTFGELGFENNASDTGTGLGGGNYKPNIVSILITRDNQKPYYQADLNGSPFIGNIGGVQQGSGPPPPPPAQVIWDLQDGPDPNNTTPLNGSFDWSASNINGDTTVLSGTSVANGVDPVTIVSTNLEAGEQYYFYTRDLPTGKVRGELLTATAVP